MPRRDESWGSVVGAALELVPLVGRVVRDRVGDLVEEGRDGLAETLRDVKEQLEQEIETRGADGASAPQPQPDEAADDTSGAVNLATPGRGLRVEPPRS